MPEVPPPYSGPTTSSDEIDVRGLLVALWGTKSVVVAGLLCFSAGFVLYNSAIVALRGVHLEWHARFVLAFEGLEDQRYPDGSRFEPSDLISTSVLSRVYEENQVSEFGIDFKKFSRSIRVEPVSSSREFLVEQYRRQLDSDQLSSDERRQIEERFRQELAADRASHIEISFSESAGVWPWRSTMPGAVVRKILIDIPEEWARQQTEETGALALSLNLYNSAWGWYGQLFDSSDVVLRGQFEQALQLFRENLGRLSGLPNSAVVRDDETGWSIVDLQMLADEVDTVVLQGELSPSLVVDGRRVSESDRRLLEQRLTDLELRRGLLTVQAGLVGDSIAAFAGGADGIATGGASFETPRQEQVFIGSATSSPQFDGEFVERLLVLVEESGSHLFRQELIERQLYLTQQATEVGYEIDRVRDLLSAIRSRDESPELNSNSEQSQEASRRSIVESAINRVDALFNSAARIATQAVSLRNGAVDPAFMESVAASRAIRQWPIDLQSIFRDYLIGAFGVTCIALLSALMLKVIRGPAERAG